MVLHHCSHATHFLLSLFWQLGSGFWTVLCIPLFLSSSLIFCHSSCIFSSPSLQQGKPPWGFHRVLEPIKSFHVKTLRLRGKSYNLATLCAKWACQGLPSKRVQSWICASSLYTLLLLLFLSIHFGCCFACRSIRPSFFPKFSPISAITFSVLWYRGGLLSSFIVM